MDLICNSKEIDAVTPPCANMIALGIDLRDRSEYECGPQKWIIKIQVCVSFGGLEK